MPEKIGKYTIASQLGRGGMGVVYKAYDESLRRYVAIKVLSDNLTDDETFLHRFVREAQAAAGISHPNIVPIYFIGEDEAMPYFVMEYVTGKSLADLLRFEGRIPNPRAAQMMLQAAHGLAAAHDQGIIHRDIKPGNLMLDERGIVKITDFGLALPVAAEKRLTATGMLVGTPGYLAPEQCRGETVDHRTDIYALGVTYYQLLSGTSPFRAESPFALMRQILEEQPPDLHALFPDVDAETLRIVSKMLAKDRNQRYQNCHELVADLEDLLAKSGVRSATAGLAMRMPTAEAGPGANAPTQVLTVAKPTAADAPTQPSVPFVEPPTLIQAPQAAAPPPAPARRSSRNAVALLVIGIFLAIGLVATYAGVTVYRRWTARQQPMSLAAQSNASTPATTPATTSSDNAALLLSQPSQPVANDTNANVASVVATTPATTTAAPAPVATTTTAAPRPAPTIARPAPATQTPAPAHAPARLSGVAVVVAGDAALTGPVATVLTEELGAAGLEKVVDAANHPSLEDVSRETSTSRLIARLREEGIATLVLARIQPTGQRELNYMGRYDTAFNARLTLTSYDVATGKAIGSASTAQMEYTSRTAEREAENVVAPIARERAKMIQGN